MNGRNGGGRAGPEPRERRHSGGTLKGTTGSEAMVEVDAVEPPGVYEHTSGRAS